MGEGRGVAMTWRAFVMLHLGVAVLGTAAVWWFVFPRAPAVALADGSTAQPSGPTSSS